MRNSPSIYAIFKAIIEPNLTTYTRTGSFYRYKIVITIYNLIIRQRTVPSIVWSLHMLDRFLQRRGG